MTINKTKTGPGKLVIGDTGDLTTFDSQVISCTLEPSVDTGDSTQVLSGEVAPGDRTESWALSGTLLADLGAEDSLQEYCFTNRGLTKPFRFTPNIASGKEFTGDLVIEAVAFGGDVGETAEPDFEFALVGEPTLAAITP